MAIEFYGIDLSPFTMPVELQLDMKGVDYRRIVPTRDVLFSDEFGVMNPMRKVPLLVVDGTPVAESQVIGELVEELFPEPSLLPESPLERARVRMISTVTNHYVATPGVKLFSNKRDAKSEDIHADSIALMARGLGALEELIAPGPYAIGETRTVADCTLAVCLFFASRVLDAMGFSALPEWGAKTTAYFEAVKKDADIARCFATMDAAAAAIPR